MAYSQKHFIECDCGCGKEFYGPDGGIYDEGSMPKGMSVEQYLYSEALAMMWIFIQFGADVGYLYEEDCVKRWFKKITSI